MTIGAAMFASATRAQPKPIDATALLGDWRVDLTSTPGEDTYYTAMTVTSVAERRLTGTFYNSVIENGRLNVGWGQVRFAFITRDGGGGQYNHSGELVDGRLLRGLSHAVARDFLSVWTADRGVIPPATG